MSTGDQTPHNQASTGGARTTASNIATATNVASASNAPTPSAPFGSTLTQPFALKLDRNNYTLWRTMVFTIVQWPSSRRILESWRSRPPRDHTNFEYLPIVLIIEARELTSWQQLQDILLSFDSKMERLQSVSGNSMKTLNGSTAPSANLTNKGGTAGTGSNPSNFGNGRGNRGGNTLNRGNRGKPFRGGRSCGRSNGPKPTCQVCGRYGHSAAHCYNHYDETYMGTAPTGGNNTSGGSSNASAFLTAPENTDLDSWYANSGATNHVTADASNLSQKSEYNGKESLVVGDGNKLLISRDMATRRVVLEGKLKDGLYQLEKATTKSVAPITFNGSLNHSCFVSNLSSVSSSHETTQRYPQNSQERQTEETEGYLECDMPYNPPGTKKPEIPLRNKGNLGTQPWIYVSSVEDHQPSLQAHRKGGRTNPYRGNETNQTLGRRA
uniref:Uncharacterized protein n=1 Tax=Cannabis sativa TaxID=3483 RepID=A0A803NLT1_CANSA